MPPDGPLMALNGALRPTSLSIIIPAYNERSRLPVTLERIVAYMKKAGWQQWEIIVVDDGSTDGTGELAVAAHNTNPCIRVLRNPGNRGKGYAVRHGMLDSKMDWRLLTDADLSAPIEELEKLWNAVKDGGAQIAIGSRALDRSLIGVHQPGFRESAGKMFNFVMRSFIGLHIRDTQCGFKLFRGDTAGPVFERQQIQRFGFDVEALFVAQKLGFRIAEIPVRWNHVDGSKVGMLNGAQSFVDLAKIRLYQISGKYR
jgi:glycosyltransferase involved in cell wall biosynthesis